MTPQELKNSILQLAIQGKLVEQRAEEGTGRELVEKNAEDAKKNLTRRRRDAEATEESRLASNISRPVEDAPLDIPDSWEWVRLGELFQHNTGKALNSSEKTGTPLSYITTSNVYWNRFELGKLKTMLFSDSEVEKCTVRKGDLLVLEGGDVGRAAIWNYDFPVRIQNHIHRLRPLVNICVQYIYYIFMLYKGVNMINGKGISIKGLSANSLHNLLIPLPPLAEQKRIVAKIEELLPLIDRYEKAWSRLEDFNKRFPVDMQKSLLQLAIQGKLVEQRADEGTGAELLEKILAAKNAEGAKSAKKGYRATSAKSAKESRLASNVSRPVEDAPFDIPESWEWVRLGEIMLDVSTGPFGSMLHKADYCDGGIPLVNPMNIQNGRIVPSDKMRVSTKTAERLSAYRLSKGMIVVARRGELGRCASVGDEQDGWLCGTGSFFLDPSKDIFVPFITLIISSPYARQLFAGKAVGTTMANLNHNLLKTLPFPLPPLAEQKRIVAKLEELLPLCERLK